MYPQMPWGVLCMYVRIHTFGFVSTSMISTVHCVEVHDVVASTLIVLFLLCVSLFVYLCVHVLADVCTCVGGCVYTCTNLNLC